MSIEEDRDGGGPSIGGLARPTGAEFYALAPDLPHLLQLPDETRSSLLVKASDDLTALEAQRLSVELARRFEDETLKEIVATPRLTRIVRQAAEGQHGAHLLLRQSRFAIEAVPPELLSRAVSDADALQEALVNTISGTPISDSRSKLVLTQTGGRSK